MVSAITAGVACAALCLSPSSAAPRPESATAAAAPGGPAAGRQEQLPPTIVAALVLGQRAQAAADQISIVDELVVVPDSATALAVISGASPNQFVPVLIDDGTLTGRENIGRFVRAFQPAAIRFVPAGKPLAAVTDSESRLAALVAAAGDISKAPPTGVVAVDVRQEDSVAGAALARGRKALLLPFAAPAQFDQLTPAAAAGVSDAITSPLSARKYTWDALGDTIDAVTIVATLPVKVRFDQAADVPPGQGPFVCKPGESLALTDLLGRKLGRGVFGSERWAWAGQISARTPADSLYRVMCAVCLRADSLFGFDGYETSDPWKVFSIAEAAARLKPVMRAGPGAMTVKSKPEGSASNWVGTTGRGVDAGLMLLNTSGNPEFFDLLPGRAFAADIPLLARPTLAHVVHSWSARSPENWSTIAGRFFSHGGYAYAGSVSEPYLQAFVPQPVLAARLKTTWPFGAAVRVEGCPPWRIAVLGDALMLPLGPKPARVAAAAQSGDGAGKTLEQMAKAAAASKSFGEAVSLFILRSQDDRAATVAALALGGDAATRAQLDTVTLGQAALAAFRTGKLAALADLASAYSASFDKGAAMNPEKGEAEPIEALWMLAQSVGLGKPTEVPDSVLEVLVKLPRPWQDEVLVRDTKWLAGVLKDRRGAMVAKRMVQERMDGAGRSEGVKAALREFFVTL